MILLDDSTEIRVLIADDHEVVRTGLRKSLSYDKRIKVLSEVSNGVEAIDAIRSYLPDLVLLDIQMPKLNGIQVTEIIKKELPEIKIIILTAFDDSDNIENALNSGADAYLTKDTSMKKLIESINTVMKGERVFSHSIQKFLRIDSESKDSTSTKITITNREQQILNLVSSGKSSQEIAELLNISIRTVQEHRSNIMQKLNIKNSSGLIRYAILNKKFI